MSPHRYDAAVIGGGLAGRAAAVALAAAGLETLHAAPPAPPDRRTSALMGPSVAFLRRIGVLDDPGSIGHPLRQIRIIDATHRLIRAPETLFDSAEAGLDAFGWNFANTALADAFETVAAARPELTTLPLAVTGVRLDGDAELTLADGSTVATRLVVGADGKKSMVRQSAGITAREHAFSQAALVCDLDLARPLGETSVEFHYDQGPLTLVPATGRRANLVWIDDRARLEAARADPAALPRLLAEKSQRLFGAVDLASPCFVFPLSRLTVDQAGARGAVLVGEAGHAFPPIGAQGLNLGLRDVADLLDVVALADRGAADWAAVLSRDYARWRAADLLRTNATVDALFRSLLADMVPAQAVRAGGLWALKLLPALRKRAFAAGMGAP